MQIEKATLNHYWGTSFSRIPLTFEVHVNETFFFIQHTIYIDTKADPIDILFLQAIQWKCKKMK